MTMAAVLTPDPAAGPFGFRGGVRPSAAGTGLAVTQDATADMFVLAASGTVFVPAAIAANAGWTCHNNGTVSLAITAASAANPRIDLVIARVHDAVDDSGSTNLWALEVVTGTPAASPAVPATPANAVALAQVAVARNATVVTAGNITDLRKSSVALGGVLPCLSTAMPASPYTGQCVFCTDTGVVMAWNGSTWRYVSSGSQTVYSTAAQQITSTTDVLITGLQVTLPAGTYRMRALVAYTGDQSGGVANTFLHAPNWSAGGVGFRFSGQGAAISGNWTAPGGNPGGGGPVMVNNGLYWHELEGIMTFSGASTTTLQAHVGTVGNTFHVQAYSYMQFNPL
jgi:hypothetical protein